MTGSGWLILALVLMLAGVLTHGPVLFLGGIILVLLAVAVGLWSRYCLDRLEYGRRFSVRRAFCGEEIGFDVRLVNRKPLPLAWVIVDDELPSDLVLRGVTMLSSHKPLRNILSNLLSLSWYEAVTRRYRLDCRHRGYYSFGPAIVRTGDLFGFATRTLDLDAEDMLLIYPRVVALSELGIPSRQLFGDLTTRQQLVQDPLRVVGVRGYAAGDSLRRVHWKATARTGELQIKVLESTTSRDIVLFLNVSTFEPDWQGIVPGLLELGIITAAAIANAALTTGESLGLYVNTNLPGSDQPARIRPADGPGQLTAILETLAMIKPFATVPMDRFLAREARVLRWSATIVLVTAVINNQLLSTLLHLRRAGRRVALIAIGPDGASVRLPGVPTYPVSEWQPWDEVQTVELRATRG